MAEKAEKFGGFYRPHKRVYKKNVGESMTQQQFKDETNINNIMAKYRKDGIVTHLNTYQGQYGNFIGAADYQTALNRVIAAREMFEEIPADIRARFGNDPAAFLSFVQDPQNLEEMREMGLAPPEDRTGSLGPGMTPGAEEKAETPPAPPVPPEAPEVAPQSG